MNIYYESKNFRDIWTMFTVQLPKFFPGPDMCVDEQLVVYRGRCNFRQYIPSKSAKCCIKTWWCFDGVTSYPLTADIYTEADRREPSLRLDKRQEWQERGGR